MCFVELIQNGDGDGDGEACKCVCVCVFVLCMVWVSPSKHFQTKPNQALSFPFLSFLSKKSKKKEEKQKTRKKKERIIHFNSNPGVIIIKINNNK